MDLNKIVRVSLKNFLYGGLVVGLLLGLLELIQDSRKLLSFYAFVSGSFFIIQIIQYEYIKNMNDALLTKFLIHSIIGGIMWVLYSILLYVLYLYKYSGGKIIILMFIIHIAITLLYYYLLKINIIE
jgi:hypothetical protein